MAPVAITLGYDKKNIKRFCQYIPIIGTLELFLKDKSVIEQLNNPYPSQEGVFQDMMVVL